MERRAGGRSKLGGEGKAVTPLKLVCSGNIPITIRHVAKTTCKGAPPHRTQTTPVRISNLCFVKRIAWTNQNPFPSTTSSWHVGARKLANHSTPPATLCDRRRSPASHVSNLGPCQWSLNPRTAIPQLFFLFHSWNFILAISSWLRESRVGVGVRVRERCMWFLLHRGRIRVLDPQVVRMLYELTRPGKAAM